MDSRKIHALTRAVEAVRATFGDDLTFQHVQILLDIAQAGTTHQRAIMDRTGLNQPTVSNVLVKLGVGRPGSKDRKVAGLKMLSMEQDPMDRRVWMLKLTPRGIKAVETMTEAL